VAVEIDSAGVVAPGGESRVTTGVDSALGEAGVCRVASAGPSRLGKYGSDPDNFFRSNPASYPSLPRNPAVW